MIFSQFVGNLLEAVMLEDLLACGKTHVPAWDVILNLIGGFLSFAAVILKCI